MNGLLSKKRMVCYPARIENGDRLMLVMSGGLRRENSEYGAVDSATKRRCLRYPAPIIVSILLLCTFSSLLCATLTLLHFEISQLNV